MPTRLGPQHVHHPIMEPAIDNLYDVLEQIYSIIKYTSPEMARQLSYRKFLAKLQCLEMYIDHEYTEIDPTIFTQYKNIQILLFELKAISIHKNAPLYIKEVADEIHSMFSTYLTHYDIYIQHV